jgi:cell wall-associated NlpC family hydrolase/peptidoglycan hydrolase CwlO-like protein
MPRRVNPVILLGIIIVAVLSFGLSAGAAPEDGAVPESVPETGVVTNEIMAPVVEPPGEGSAPSEVPAPENTVAPGEGKAPEGSAPVGEGISEDDVAQDNGAAQDEGAAASEEKEDTLEEVTTPGQSPAQEDAESDVTEDVTPEEAEIGEVAEEAGNEFQTMLTEAEAADGEYNNALLEENQLSIEMSETRNDLATAEERLEDRASQVYMDGPVGFLGMLLGASDFSAFKDLLGLGVQLLDQDQKEVEEHKQKSQDLEAQLEEWEQTREEASTKKEEAETSVEQAQEFLEAQDQKVQEKIEKDRTREAELALDYVGNMLQDATGEQPSEPAAGEEENSDKIETAGEKSGQAEEDQSETGANETTGGEQAVQLAGEDKSEEIEQARQAGAEAPDRTPEEEQVRGGEVAQALSEAIQEWQAQKKPLAEAIQEPVKEREAGATPNEGSSGSPAQNPAAEQMAAAAKAQEQSTKAAEQVAAEKKARENATARAEEAKKAELAVELLPAAEQEAARAAAQEAERNATLAADKATEQKLAAEEAAKKATEQKAAENGILNPKPGTSGTGVLDYAETWKGVPYDYSHMGGMTRAKVDCSAFTAAVYKKFGIDLPDSPVGQLGMGAPVRGTAKAGDLVFFSEDHSGVPTHVGIANGDGTLTHASNFTGEVSVTDMDHIEGYMGARRLI